MKGHQGTMLTAVDAANTLTVWGTCWKPCVILVMNEKHLKNVGPIRHCEPPHAHSPGVASGTVALRLRIDVHDNDNAWQRGPLWPHGMGPISQRLPNLKMKSGCGIVADKFSYVKIRIISSNSTMQMLKRGASRWTVEFYPSFMIVI